MNIEVKTNAKAYATGSILVNAPVEKVFSLIANIGEWPGWLEGVVKVTMDGNAEEGKEFDWISRGYRIKSKIHTYIKNSEIGWTGTMLWIKAVHNWNFEKQPGGKTKVAVQESLTGFLSPIMKKTLISRIKKDLNTLKMQCEKQEQEHGSGY